MASDPPPDYVRRQSGDRYLFSLPHNLMSDGPFPFETVIFNPAYPQPGNADLS